MQSELMKKQNIISVLTKLIEEGESEYVEFKSALPHSEILAKILVAFANTNGGYLIIGVNDNGRIVGLSEEEAELAQKKIRNITSSLLPYSVEIGSARINGKIIVYAKVDKAPPEFSPISTSSGEVFIRHIGAIKSAISAIMCRNMAHNVDAHLLEYVEKQKQESPKIDRKIKIFVAMSFRDEEEPALVDYFMAIIRAAQSVDSKNLDIIRVDLIEGDYEISQKVIDEIEKCDVIITDFTLSSHNVYFELGYARAKNKRIIQIARKGTQLEFDIRNWRTIFYRNATELETKLIPELKSAIKDIVNCLD